NFAFKTGRALVFNQPTQTAQMGSIEQLKQWSLHNRLLTSIGRAFGMTANSFGTQDPGTGLLAQL
ncbi:MAG: hypothetical protein ABUR63_06130, partial [Verrucomicrobiota bacterium]